ncbi:MAG: hypothetical protein JO199_01760, partial [Candidatus Eremiobacteraeota bacterium]|nr:hypothetical protein [Candidatus Eremiobacteraeota bacterium]
MRRLIVALALASLTACNGGVPATPFAIAHGAATTQPERKKHKDGSLRLVIKLPRCAGKAARHLALCRPSRHHPHFLSPATKSIKVVFTPSSGPVPPITKTANLTVGSSGCVSTLSTTQCTLVTQQLPPFNWTVVLTTYDGTLDGGGNPTGNVLSAGSAGFTITANHTTTLNLTLSGVPASTIVVPNDTLIGGDGYGNYHLYGLGAHRFLAEALDADGDVIAGPGSPVFAVTTPSGTLTGVTSSPSTTTSSAPNTFTVTPPSTYTTGTASFTVTPTFSGTGLGDGCAQSGAYCGAVTVSVDMQEIIYVSNYLGHTIIAYDVNGTQIPNAIYFNHFFYPSNLTYASNGLLYVPDEGQATVDAFDLHLNKQALKGIFSFEYLSIPTSVAQDPDTSWLYAVDSVEHAIRAYDLQGDNESLDVNTGNSPQAIAFAPVGSISPYS